MSQNEAEKDPRSSYSSPRWLKVSVVIFIVLVLLFGILHLTTGNGMGPSMHMPSIEQSTQQP